MTWEILQGDCVDIMRLMDSESIDSTVTDPPYGLEFMGKDFDKLGKGAQQREWHKRWAIEAFRVLKPGGYILAFGGTRTYHHLASALEEEGFEIRDSLLWLYGTGFPKSHNALKPSHEPIVVARKPLVGTVVTNVLEYGTGALNIDGCRIEATDDQLAAKYKSIQNAGSRDNAIYGKDSRDRAGASPHDAGRWPANVVLSEEAAAELDERTQKASRFFYCAKASTKERNAGLENRNDHPTVKPISLMTWLCRLVTPPSGIVFDPFAGSGSTGIAAIQEGFDFLGIELNPAYVEVAKARMTSYVSLQ